MTKPTARNGKKEPQVTELPKITINTDTRDILAHAARDQELNDYFIVDVDAHVTEMAFWTEVTDLIDSDVYRQWRKPSATAAARRPACSTHARHELAGRVRPHPARAHQGERAARQDSIARSC